MRLSIVKARLNGQCKYPTAFSQARTAAHVTADGGFRKAVGSPTKVRKGGVLA